MSSKCRMLFLVPLLITYNIAVANVFVVTTNANSGSGSLRDAIINCATNGTSVNDTIVFNFPDTSRSGRTITLLSSLPQLSSNLVIDGTTQNGAAFGISNAKIIITVDPNIAYFICFEAKQAINIGIYGLYLKGANNNSYHAFSLWESNNIYFGAPGKGNIVCGFLQAFHCNLTSSTDAASNNVTFQNNLLGIDESGNFANFNTFNATTFSFKNVNNLQIGGLGANEGNIICNSSFIIDVTYTRPFDSGYLRINGNKIGTDRTGLIRLNPITSQGGDINGYNDGSSNPEGTTKIDVEIINNISGESFQLYKIQNYFKIKGNKFGVGADGITDISGTGILYGIGLLFCGHGIIGGPNESTDKNYLANSNGYGVYEFHCGPITISKNSFFCNGIGIAISYNTWLPYGQPPPFVSINGITSSQVFGKSLPNATIELFYGDQCSGCEGKTYIGSANADSGGNWFFNVANTVAIVATATSSDGGTIGFSTATINVDSIVVTNATCGRANGSIKNLKIISGTAWHWEDSQGNIISTDTNLINVPPGQYKFVTSIGGNTCETISNFYEVKNIPVPSMDTTSIVITQPYCGTNNGVLNNTTPFNSLWKYSWENSAGVTINADYSQQNPYNYLWPDNYFLKIALRIDSTCFVRYGAFMLTNQSGPSINFNTVQIKAAVCSQLNGSITGIQFNNITGTPIYYWYDSLQKLVGTTQDLLNVGAGRYKLKFKDQSICDTITTPFFLIPNAGSISFDTSAMIITAGKCSSVSGSIKNILVNNGFTYKWIDTISRNIVSFSNNLLNVVPGYYKLIATSALGCIDSTRTFFIPQASASKLSVTSITVKQEACDRKDGKIQIINLQPSPTGYTFQWIDSATNQVISTGLGIQNVAAGKYYFYAKDSNDCKQLVDSIGLSNLHAPVINPSASILPDVCNMQNGAINQVNIIGSAPFIYNWYNSSRLSVAQDKNLQNVSAGGYYLVVSDVNACVDTSSLFIIPNSSQIVDPPIYNQVVALKGSTATLNLTNTQNGIYKLFSSQTSTNPIQTNSTGNFITGVLQNDTTVFVLQQLGSCLSQLTPVSIKVVETLDLAMPNAFTPNNDGYNDTYGVKYPQLFKTIKITIFNRYGQKVFESSNPAKGWDGTANGLMQPAGNYVWIINYTNFLGNSKTKIGNVLLIR